MADPLPPALPPAPVIFWKMTWYDGRQYGAAFSLPLGEMLRAPGLREFLLEAVAGNELPDDAKSIGEIVGRQITETIRELAGADHDIHAITEEFIDQSLAILEQRQNHRSNP